ncbi:glucan biosynthesis protein [Alsobacter soli]|uniref:glucan biosynthesis protein n=1 Tax=Alsobacter soli TaxID=2109933 RepID=UPI001FE1B705|nr:glucan biosynthesis protein G [Alsobacter soli]
MPHPILDRRRFTALGGAALAVGPLAAPGALAQTAPAQPPAQSPPPPAPPPSPPPQPNFRFEDVIDRARRLAGESFQAEPPPLPPELAQLDYDAYRDIRFRPEKALLGENGSPFRMQLFHLGFLFKRPVVVNVIDHGVAAPVPYSASLFDYGKNKFPGPLPIGLGFAGFRLHYPLNNPDQLDELAVFLGASYFRFLSRGQRYGLSARGLSIGSGQPDEEFPFFREFWVEHPAKGDEFIVVYALLDGASVTGAYQIILRPGPETVAEVRSQLFPRKPIPSIGVAPLTSMFYTSENDRRLRDDFRNEIHDSDGLLVHTGGGEWIWRPLANPPAPRTSHFGDKNPAGFGLLQRDRNFARYEDLEARYDLRPSYWVEPRGDWGEGSIDLVELNTPDETNDNIVAFWRPAKAPEPGAPLELNYLIRSLDSRELHRGGKAAGTFQTGLAGPPGSGDVVRRRFMVDFTGGDLPFYQASPKRVALFAEARGGRLARSNLEPNPVTRGFRAYLDIEAPKAATVEMRSYLTVEGHPMTETWAFAWRAPD